MHNKRLLLPVALIVLAVVVAVAQRQSHPQIDDTLAFQRVDGALQQYADFRGKPLLLTFWSPSCVICMHEVKQLNALYQQGGGLDFELLGVSMAYDRPDHVLEARTRTAMAYPVYLDLYSHIAEAFGRVTTTPTSFLIDADGQIVLRLDGKLDFRLITKSLNQLTA